MSQLTEEQIRAELIGIISDGFNRSLNALEQAGALSTRKLRKRYTGVGSKYYDLVTEQIEYTARFGAESIQQLLEENSSN